MEITWITPELNRVVKPFQELKPEVLFQLVELGSLSNAIFFKLRYPVPSTDWNTVNLSDGSVLKIYDDISCYVLKSELLVEHQLG